MYIGTYLHSSDAHVLARVAGCGRHLELAQGHERELAVVILKEVTYDGSDSIYQKSA